MEEGNRINEYLTTVTAGLSFFGTLFIIISFFVWKDIRTTSRRILVYISVADFCTSVATIAAITSFWINRYESRKVCLAQSILGTLSVLCSFMWTVFMATFLYISVCKKNSILAEKLMLLFHAFGWGIPIVIVCIAVSKGKLGDNGNKVTSGWCWVSKTLEWNDQVLWMLLAGKLWEIIAYFVIVVLYALIKRNMTKEVSFTYSILPTVIMNGIIAKHNSAKPAISKISVVIVNLSSSACFIIVIIIIVIQGCY